MIAHLRGRLLGLNPELAVLDVQGVGYAVHLPLSTYYELQRLGAGSEVSLFVHTHVREDALALYGFWSERERALFERLITVSGVGPRLARAILSGLPPEELLRALAAGDVARLTRIPGVGKKTAERLVLELREKAVELQAATTTAPEPGDEDLLVALVNLGYKRADADQALAEVRRETKSATVPELLRLALKRLARL
ncbi:MAG TPA: Holliday junction branch migration protein RuvA [Thermoanaerobaculia bacterium]|jgi:Holliday junction DNA helicase RuvA|nr:Holliday junction branch migration protein RuvA [Thermoanaerobaculia bacterium]